MSIQAEEMLLDALSDLVAGLDKTNWSSWQTTAYFWPALEKARAALAQVAEVSKG